MSFERINGSRARVLALAGSIIAIGVWAVTSTRVDAQQPESWEKNAGQRSRPHFYLADPIWQEEDTREISTCTPLPRVWRKSRGHRPCKDRSLFRKRGRASVGRLEPGAKVLRQRHGLA